MKTLVTIILGVTLFSTAAQAKGGRSSHSSSGASSYRSSSGSHSSSRSSAYVYRNPHAAYPSVGVRGYSKSNGTAVMPHYRTPANNTVTDNLSYRGFGIFRMFR